MPFVVVENEVIEGPQRIAAFFHFVFFYFVLMKFVLMKLNSAGT
jgi:hypothetical protein